MPPVSSSATALGIVSLLVWTPSARSIDDARVDFNFASFGDDNAFSLLPVRFSDATALNHDKRRGGL